MARQQTQDITEPLTTQVAARTGRRRFTAEYKVSVVQQAAACRAPREIGALLQRGGLYSSHLTMWRQHAAIGARRALAQRRGPAAKRTTEASAVARLERVNTLLREALARDELVIALQKKLAALLDHSPAPSGALS
jgi:transposase-like protein